MGCAILLLLTSSFFASMIGYQEAAKLDPVHLIMTKEERMTVFGTEDQIPEYHLVQPVKLIKGRHRRNLNWEPSNADLILTVTTSDDEFILHLNNRRNLVRTPLKVNVRDVNEVDTHYMLEHPKCLYRGKVIGMNDSAVALSTCNPNEMAGIVQFSTEERYILAPLPNRIRRTISQESDFHNGSSHHVLYKQGSRQFEFYDNSEKRSFRETETPDISTIESTIKNVRPKRQTQSDYVVEMAVHVDDVLYSQIAKQHPKEIIKATVNLVCTYINAMQLIYEQPSLSVSIGFVIVGIYIMKSPKGGPAKGDGDIDDYIESFAHWQEKQNPLGEHNVDHWDHAMMLTGLDLYAGPKQSKVFIGSAYTNGMCDPTFSVSICEARAMNSPFILSHEIGHNLGMRHDGKDNTCNANGYIMSTTTGPGKTTWSECSDKHLLRFLQTNSWCLKDEAYITAELDHRSNVLPGEKYDIKEQCLSSRGSGARPTLSSKYPFNNICRELWCKVGNTNWLAHPALDGTSCESSRVCFHGDCVERIEVMDYLKARNLVFEE